MMKFNKNNGFTIIEVMVAFVILAALVGLALPQYTTSVEKSRLAEGLEILTSLREAQIAYQLENNAYTTTLSALDITIPTAKYFNNPPTLVAGPATLAQVTRTGSYTLTIAVDGTITCSGGSGNICQKVGY